MQIIHTVVEKYREQILAAERFIWAHPETGYRETVTDNISSVTSRNTGQGR